MALPLRLQALLDRCAPGLPLWDLCCDHGLLGLAALASGKFPEVIFNDSVPHVLTDLEPRLADFANARRVLSLAEDIGESLTGNLVLAGIGGEKIFNILKSHNSHGRLNAHRLIACPEKRAEWLAAQNIAGYRLAESLTIPHNRGSRKILVFEIQ